MKKYNYRVVADKCPLKRKIATHVDTTTDSISI